MPWFLGELVHNPVLIQAGENWSAGMFDGLKRSHAKLTGKAEAGVLPSIGFGVVAAFTGQMVAFPLEAVARRMQVLAHPVFSWHSVSCQWCPSLLGAHS